MENASKALLIAGAVLIVILLISVGIMIFNSSKGLFSSATSSMSDQEISMFNSKFTMYEGKNVSGSQARECIRAVETNNSNDDYDDVTLSGIKDVNTVVTTKRYVIECSKGDTGLINTISITER